MMDVRAYQQCTRCVMDTSDPEIRFDAAGVCNHCTDYLRKMSDLVATGRAGQENLARVVDGIKARGKGRRYDAVLGISGGVDSSYLALLLKQLDVRTLLVHMDNGWDTSQAVRNIANVVAKTGFDYESDVLDWEQFRAIQLSFLMASVVEAETPTDMAIPAVLNRSAARHGINQIISASNEASEGILPRLWHYNARDLRYFRSIHRRFGDGQTRSFPIHGIKQEFVNMFLRRIRTIYLLNYVGYKRADAVAHLRRELDWSDYGGKHHESEFTKFVQNYLLPVKFGLDYRRATLSTLICSGGVSRTDAIKELKTSTYNEAEEKSQRQFVARKLGIKYNELELIIRRPGVYYFNYPNDERRLKLIYGLYTRISSLAPFKTRR